MDTRLFQLKRRRAGQAMEVIFVGSAASVRALAKRGDFIVNAQGRIFTWWPELGVW